MTRIDFPTHEISVEIGGMTISGFATYEISTSMLEPVSHFHMSIPFEREVWDICVPDSSIRVLIDSVVVLVGLLDERLVPEDGEVVEILGRSMMGRLVDESCPSFSFEGLDLFALIRKAADIDTPKKYPWFKTVTFSNARNRTVLRGKGKKSKAAGEPIKISTKKTTGSRIEPGQTRWHVIENAIEQAGYIAFASGDGTELIVGKPNYAQEPQFRFFMPKSGSDRAAESTVLGMGVREALTNRYSRCICVGSGIGTEANYGSAVASRYGEATNNGLDPTGEGIGAEFMVPKRLIIVRSVDSIDEARELARREMARRDAQGTMVTVVSQGHGQVVAGQAVTLFAPDTIASVEDERTGFEEECLIVSCVYRCARANGEETEMTLVVSGAELSAA